MDRNRFFFIKVIFILIILLVFFGCDSEIINNDVSNDDKFDVEDVFIEDNSLNDSVYIDEHDYFVEIEGSVIKTLTVREVAELWEINSEVLLSEIINEFNFKRNYTIDTILEEMRQEYKFSPAIIKDLAENIKSDNI
jgi:hypothetical protein